MRKTPSLFLWGKRAVLACSLPMPGRNQSWLQGGVDRSRLGSSWLLPDAVTEELLRAAGKERMRIDDLATSAASWGSDMIRPPVP